MFTWIAGFIESAGYPAIALMMFAENLFPPIPSELIMPLAGFSAARGELDIVLVVVSGTAGSLAGATFWYVVALRLGCDRLKRWSTRHGRWMAVSPGEVDRAAAWFDRHGGKAVLGGRLVPAVRTLISLPAGFAGMPLRRFLFYSALGTAVWTALLAVAGNLLGERYAAVAGYLDPASNVVVGAIVLYYAYRVATFARRPSS